MATLRTKKFTGSDVVECIESHHVQLGGVPSFYIAGARLKGDSDAVKANPQFFAISGSPHADIDQQRRELHATERPPEPEIVRTRIERRLRDEDAVVAKWGVQGVRAGERLDKRDIIAQENPDAFVAVVGKGMTRADSYRVLQTMTHTDGEGDTRVVYAGTWIGKD